MLQYRARAGRSPILDAWAEMLTHSPPHSLMGMIADRLRARLDEMAARHAQTDREIAELKIQAQAAFDRWQAAAAALDAELAD